MSKVNSGKLALGTVIASVIFFVTDGMMHEMMLKPDWQALFAGLGGPPPHDPMAMAWFAFFELGRGFVSIFLYVMMRARFGAGPKTAALAGGVSWVAFTLTGPVQMIPLGLFSTALWVKMCAVQLVVSVAATNAGAAPYSER